MQKYSLNISRSSDLKNKNKNWKFRLFKCSAYQSIYKVPTPHFLTVHDTDNSVLCVRSDLLYYLLENVLFIYFYAEVWQKKTQWMRIELSKIK